MDRNDQIRSLEVIKGHLIGNDLTSSDVPPIYPGAFELGRCPNFGLIRNSSLEGSSERGGYYIHEGH